MKIDLNLFVVFEAIYCEGNISKAASALNLSQPAVSHSLAKLRDHFDDKLFIRQGNQMRPTALAKNVIGDVREALHQLQTSLYQSQNFEELRKGIKVLKDELVSAKRNYENVKAKGDQDA